MQKIYDISKRNLKSKLSYWIFFLIVGPDKTVSGKWCAATHYSATRKLRGVARSFKNIFFREKILLFECGWHGQEKIDLIDESQIDAWINAMNSPRMLKSDLEILGTGEILEGWFSEFKNLVLKFKKTFKIKFLEFMSSLRI